MQLSIYKPLLDGSAHPSDADGHWSLRTLTVAPGPSGSKVVCQLNHALIAQFRGHVEALSYVWGTDPGHETIQVNGVDLEVTPNLAKALGELRSDTHPRVLWVDAVCINQKDSAEKSVQVQRMGAVYKNAKRVLVFLGPEGEQSSQAMQLLGNLSRLGEGDYASISQLLNDDSLVSTWNAIHKLLYRPWWTRAWIIQEYVVAKDVLFKCGSAEMSGDTFAVAIQRLVDFRFKADIADRHQYLIRHVANTLAFHLWSTRRDYHNTLRLPEIHVMDILYKFRAFRCYDPRDKVFSIFALIRFDPALVPDYTRDLSALYKAVVQYSVRSSGTLEILSHHNKPLKTAFTLPSWCPDWTIMRGKRILLWPNNYQAAGRFMEARADFAGDSMTLYGVQIDEISFQTGFVSDDFKSKSYIHDAILSFTAAIEAKVYPGLERTQRLNVFRRSLVADRIRPGGPQQPSVCLSDATAQRLWKAWSTSVTDQSQTLDAAARRDVKVYDDALYSALCGRSIIATKSGRVGLVDGSAMIGDVICVFSGGSVPMCLQPTGATGRRLYELVGECYLHGCMNGETVAHVTHSHLLESITLI